MDISAWVWSWTILSLLGLGAAIQVLLLRLARGRMAMRTRPGELPWNGARQFLFGMLLVADAVVLVVLIELAAGGVWNVLHPPLSSMDQERVRLMAIGRTLTSAVVCAYMIGLIVTWYTLDRLTDEDDEKRHKLAVAAPQEAAETARPHTPVAGYPNPYSHHPSGPLSAADLPPDTLAEEDTTATLPEQEAPHDA